MAVIKVMVFKLQLEGAALFIIIQDVIQKFKFIMVVMVGNLIKLLKAMIFKKLFLASKLIMNLALFPLILIDFSVISKSILTSILKFHKLKYHL